ncbi:MAG: alpha/beta hydrolase-fold protein [Pseudomonadota bacterium]
MRTYTVGFTLLLAAGFSLTIALFSASAVNAQPADTQNSEAAAYVLSDSEVRTIESESLGRRYKLQIKLPPGYNAEKNVDRKYPVIYFNDATYTWLTAVGVTIFPFHTDVFEKAILVGISHAVGEKSQLSRTRDYTPTDAPDTRYKSGGARQYLTFLKEEVLPFVEATYRADPDRRMLSGVSYGGLFGAYALLEEPGLFHDYILTSPSLWHNKQVMFDLEDAFAASGKQLTGRVYFATGEAEIPTVSPGFYDMVGQQGAFAEKLRSRGYKDFEVRDEVIEGGTHLTTYPIGLTRALRWLLPGNEPYHG